MPRLVLLVLVASLSFVLVGVPGAADAAAPPVKALRDRFGDPLPDGAIARLGRRHRTQAEPGQDPTPLRRRAGCRSDDPAGRRFRAGMVGYQSIPCHNRRDDVTG
jgi:hypothetical protein